MKNIKTIINSILVVFLFSACNRDNNIQSDTGIKNNTDIVNTEKQDSSEEIKQDIFYVKSKSIVFFSLSEKEFKSFLRLTGKESEWEFNLIYKRFKKLSENAEKALNKTKNADFDIYFSESPVIAFIKNNGDTIFLKRKEDDLFVGQVFFNGKDSVTVEEGLMPKDTLEKYIEKYFNTETFKIERPVISIDTKKNNKPGIAVDTAKTENKDSLNIQ